MKEFDLSALKLEVLPVFDANGNKITDRLRYATDSKRPAFVLIIPEGNDYRVKYRDCVCTVHGELNLDSIANALEFCGYHPAKIYNRIGKIDSLLT